MTLDTKKRGLGRGLGALITNTSGEPAGAEVRAMDGARTLPVAALHPNPHQPRSTFDPLTLQELADSIKEKGILEPLIVVRHPEKPDGFLVVAGHRRRTAAELAGLAEASVIVRGYSPVEQEEVMLAENIQREELSPLQEAKAYQRLVAGEG